jgi:hypothetical protein
MLIKCKNKEKLLNFLSACLDELEQGTYIKVGLESQHLNREGKKIDSSWYLVVPDEVRNLDAEDK